MEHSTLESTLEPSFDAALPLVATVIDARFRWFWRAPGRHLHRSDLIQEGAIGLARAIDLYDPGRGASFFTFASTHIWSAVIHAIRDQEREIRVAAHVQEQQRRAQAGSKAKAAPLPKTCSIEVLSEIDGTIGMREFADPGAEWEVSGRYQCQEWEALLHDALARLRPNELRIIRLSCGFGEDEPLSDPQIGRLLGVNGSTVGYIRRGALAALRRRLPPDFVF